MNKPLEYTFEVQCKTDVSPWGLWHWQIRRTSTGEIVESSKDEFTTEEECRDQGAPFFGDWFKGHMSIQKGA